MNKMLIYLSAIVFSLYSCTDKNNKAEPLQKDGTAGHTIKPDTIAVLNFEETISIILKAFETKNDSLVNSFVSPEHGVVICLPHRRIQ
jgi:hypothetical protein